jgi:agmatinase
VTISDYGNIQNESVNAFMKNSEMAIEEILTKGSIPIIIGGDHTISLPAVEAVANIYGDEITLIHFDAHIDYLDEFEEIPHGSVMREIRNKTNIKKIIHCGLRGNLSTRPGINQSKDDGNIIIRQKDLAERGENEVLKHLDLNEKVYISIDVDFFDSSVAFATGVPELGGMNFLEFRDMLKKIIDKVNVVGLDVCEYNPLLDFNKLTGRNVCNFLFYTMKDISKNTP